MATDSPLGPPQKDGLRKALFVVIFGHETAAGRNFDIALLAAIVGSMLAVLLESVESIRVGYGDTMRAVEWIFTVLFSIEYALRVYCVSRPWRYVFSFFGAIDLLSVLPSLIALLIPGSQALSVVRALRLLRVFRILKLGRFVKEADTLLAALAASRIKIIVFLGAILTIVVVLASIMYLVEGEESGFTSIPRAMYWAVVTLTTVGYGDIAPRTVLGQAIAALVMILGYSIIAVPTGIVSVSLNEATRRAQNATDAASALTGCCGVEHADDAKFCRICGKRLSRSARI